MSIVAGAAVVQLPVELSKLLDARRTPRLTNERSSMSRRFRLAATASHFRKRDIAVPAHLHLVGGGRTRTGARCCLLHRSDGRAVATAGSHLTLRLRLDCSSGRCAHWGLAAWGGGSRFVASLSRHSLSWRVVAELLAQVHWLDLLLARTATLVRHGWHPRSAAGRARRRSGRASSLTTRCAVGSVVCHDVIAVNDGFEVAWRCVDAGDGHLCVIRNVNFTHDGFRLCFERCWRDERRWRRLPRWRNRHVGCRPRGNNWRRGRHSYFRLKSCRLLI